ncbi:MAG: hypothetical protein V5A62_00605 [Haloarculaceae archaeon]
MREVRTCDFCGEEAAGTFEAVPAERDPSGDGRRLVLCTGCRDTLASVLEPLLDGAAAGDSAGAGAGPGADGTSPAGGGGDPTAAGSDGGTTGDDEGAETAGGGSRSPGRGTPRGYRKVMRFLENRDLPVDREEAETLAAEAYEMDPGAVSAAIDHAVKHNRLREVSGELRQ